MLKHLHKYWKIRFQSVLQLIHSHFPLQLSASVNSEILITNSPYIDYAVKKKEKACCIAVLPGRRHEVNVVMLYEQVGDAIVVHNRIMGLRITLNHN